ncbi:MAG: MBL fold metallo-hydrolase [Kiloniellales bacterium]|nr:MBL fold metallo-hydrolase [Kiloniellales bacterium]
MGPRVKAFFDEDTFTVSYVVSEPEGGHAAIIDSVLDFDPKSARSSTRSADAIIDHLATQSLRVDWILETHLHADHMTAASYLKQQVGGRSAIGKRITEVQATFKALYNLGPEFAADGSDFDYLFADGETFRIGALEARVLATPGHTPACVTYLIGDAAFVGDTIFMPDYGSARTDFPGGDAATLYRSIRKLFALPPETHMFLCHDYKAPGRDHFAWETTVAEQRDKNIHLHDGIDEDAFVKLREERDKTLQMPALILPSVQVNLRAGRFPPPEDNGIAYLRIPLNAL